MSGENKNPENKDPPAAAKPAEDPKPPTKEDIKNMDPSKFTDLIINNLVVSKIGNVFDAGFELSAGNITKLLVLMSTSELKTMTVSTISYVGNLLRISPAYGFNLLTIIVAKLYGYFERKKEVIVAQQTAIIEAEDPRCRIGLTVDTYFMIAFYKYLTQQPGCKFDYDLMEIDIKNSKENIFVRKYSNIRININDICFLIEKPIIYGFDLEKGEVVEIYIDKNISVKQTKKNVELFSDLLSEDQSTQLKEIVFEFQRQYSSLDACLAKMHAFFGGEQAMKSYFTEFNIVEEILVTAHPNMKKKESILELIIFSRILYKQLGINIVSNIYSSLKDTGKIAIDLNNKYAFNKAYSNIHNIGYDISFGGIKSYESDNADHMKALWGAFYSYKEQAKKKDDEKDSKKNQFPLEIILESSIDEQTIDKNAILENFVASVNSYHKKNTTKIKIFSLKLFEEITEKEEENPEYAEWAEKKKMLEEMNEKKKTARMEKLAALNAAKGDKTPSTSLPTSATSTIFPEDDYSYGYGSHYHGYGKGYGQSPYAKFLAEKVPPKTIIMETVNKKVISTKLNEGEKNIDTLYLRERDRKRIMCALTQFRDKKELLKEVGLQNKLNILLYGLPGTGKSSTIQAVATFLQKDIYYIDLKKAQSNEDLQLLINHVNVNVPHGGLIVMEDIDAMSNVVLDRKNRMNGNVADLLDAKDSELSLEYLLNILQGTLTIDNSVFMVTTNHIDHLDPAFYRDGRFDVKIELKLCDHYQISCIFKKMIGREIKKEVLAKIKEDTLAPATIIFHIKNYMFDKECPDEEICEELIEKSHEKNEK